MTVSELARRAGVTADTVRHYTRSGLLVPIRDESNGYNCYSNGDLARLLFIRKARLLGFSVRDVRDILKVSSHGRSPCSRVRKIMEQRLQETRCGLRDLEKLQARMEGEHARRHAGWESRVPPYRSNSNGRLTCMQHTAFIVGTVTTIQRWMTVKCYQATYLKQQRSVGQVSGLPRNPTPNVGLRPNGLNWPAVAGKSVRKSLVWAPA